jgi:hypothetical protein
MASFATSVARWMGGACASVDPPQLPSNGNKTKDPMRTITWADLRANVNWGPPHFPLDLLDMIQKFDRGRFA